MFAVDSLRDLATHDKNATNANPDLVKIRAAALFAQLKAANRAANTATRQAKDATAAARQEMDQSHLGLQNLLYEKRHLEREIEKCRQFAYVGHSSCCLGLFIDWIGCEQVRVPGCTVTSVGPVCGSCACRKYGRGDDAR